MRLQGPESAVTIKLPYAQDFDKRKLTLGEGGVSIEVSDTAVGSDSLGVRRIGIRAQRLALEHEADRIALAGSVTVTTADSVTLTTDSLRWSRSDDLLHVPGWADITRPDGSLRARDLTATTSLDSWSARNVTGSSSGTTDAGTPYELQVRAKRDSSTRPRGGHLHAAYETVSVRTGGQRVDSERAQFDEQQGHFSFSGGVVLTDSLRAISADRLDHDLGNGTSSASGSVVVEEKDWRLQAQVIDVDEDGKRWISSGVPVLVEWEGRSLSAAQLTYDDRAEALFSAAGDPVTTARIEFRDGDRLMIADSLTYHPVAGRVEAEGDVALTGPGFVGVVRAERALLSLDDEQAQLSGSPRLIRQRQGDDDLVIAAGTMRLDLADRQMVGEGAFAVNTGSLRLEARRGQFDSSSETLTLSREVVLAARAATIRCDSMVVTLVDGEVVDIDLPSTLTGSVAASASQVSWLEAGRGHLLLESERVQGIALSGDARVTHRSFERDAINRFTATDIDMSFADGQLVTVNLEGDAVVESRLPDTDDEDEEGKVVASSSGDDHSGSILRVAGNRLHITLEDGAVLEVKALESVEGEFVPAPSKAPPTNGD